MWTGVWAYQHRSCQHRQLNITTVNALPTPSEEWSTEQVLGSNGRKHWNPNSCILEAEACNLYLRILAWYLERLIESTITLQTLCMAVTLPVTIGVAMLLGWNTYLVYCNKTTIEHYEGVTARVLASQSGQAWKHPYDLGPCGNLAMICGQKPQLWAISCPACCFWQWYQSSRSLG